MYHEYIWICKPFVYAFSLYDREEQLYDIIDVWYGAMKEIEENL